MSVNAEAGVSSGGYSRVVPVDRDKLRDLGVNKIRCNQFASAQNTASLNIVEFFHALPYYPIAFIRQINNSYTPCAVLGLSAAENLFTDDEGNWQDGVYSPASIRRYPFITEAVTVEELKTSNEDCRKAIFVDESALVKDAPSLFIANGVATPEWEVIESFISDYISAERATVPFMQKLDSLKLLEPFDAQIHPNDGNTMRLKGLYRVNENKLNKLPDKVIKELMLSGELSRIYAHLISLEHFAKLLDRSARRKQQ